MDVIFDRRPPRSQSYLITGASTGIGRALAVQLASETATRALGLVARRKELLQQLKRQIQQEYPQVFVEILPLDCTETSKIPEAFSYFHNTLGPLTTVVVNHALGNPKSHEIDGSFKPFERIFQVNVASNAAVIDAALRYAQENKGEVRRIHIVVVSSLVVYLPIYASATYYASKVGLEAYIDAVKGGNLNADFTVIRPGYVDTPMTDHLSSSRFSITADQAAEDIARGIKAKKSYVVTPWIMTIVIWLMWLAPMWLKNFIANWHLDPEAIEKRKMKEN